MHTPSQHKKRAAVIGSGFGGLAAAIRLQAAGFDTTLYEARELPGGRAYRYEIDGYKFDAGPTVVTVPETLEELFTLAGRKLRDYVELLPVDPFYRLYWENGLQFDYCRDPDQLLKNIEAVEPSDVKGYHRFSQYAEEVYKQGYEELCHVPFLRFWDMIKISPQLLKLSAYRSVYSSVSKYIKNEYLRQAFSFNSLLIGGNPFQASSIYTLIHPLEKKFGVWFPRGGTFALVQGLVKLFEDIGGHIRLATPVDEIVTKRGRVVGLKAKGELRHFDAVVSNADVTATYNKLLKKEWRAKPTAFKLRNMRHSMSLFVIYFGTKKQYPNLVHHNILFANRYKGLLDDIFHNGLLADDFSIYLHAPSKSDSSLAPKGCESFYALAPVPNLDKLPVDWAKVGPAYAQRILNYLEKHYLPDLSQNITVQKIFTPQDFADQLDAYQGAAFSLEPTLTQSAWFRVHNRDDWIKGLYFVGAGTHPGAGIPGVVGSAKATASVLLSDYGLSPHAGGQTHLTESDLANAASQTTL